MTKDSSEKSEPSLSDLKKDKRNANKGTKRGQQMIIDSITEDGFGRSGLIDKHGNLIAGNKTTIAAEKVYGDVKPIIIKTNGDRPVYVQRVDLDLEDEDPNNPARRIAYRDNFSSQISFMLDTEVALEDIDLGFDFEGIGISPEDLQKWFGDNDKKEKPKPGEGRQPNKRDLPIDLIFTWSEYTTQYVSMAYYSGWFWGVRSKNAVMSPSYDPHYPVSFVDNEYTDYDHDLHLGAVRKFSPKYCTTRDLMTKRQCAEAGIEYYTFAQIMRHAEELANYSENVIVIPKYDCLDKIPEQYILGYSVPTTHGGTPLPPSAFKGRPVHLLGGSWKAQLDYMAELGDDVVSLDNNYIHKAAEFGSFVYPDGTTNDIQTLFGFPLVNHITVAFAISLGMISTKVKELYGEEEDDIQAPGEEIN